MILHGRARGNPTTTRSKVNLVTLRGVAPTITGETREMLSLSVARTSVIIITEDGVVAHVACGKCVSEHCRQRGSMSRAWMIHWAENFRHHSGADPA